MIVSIIWNSSKLYASYLIRATAIFVVDGCQFGPSWILGWKWSLWPVPTWLAVQQREYLFSRSYMIVSMIWNSSELSALQIIRATAIFVVYCCQFGPNWNFGLKWRLWPMPAWLAVQRNKAVFFLTFYDSSNDMKLLWTLCITPQPCHSHLCCWLLPIWPYWMFGLKIEGYGQCRIDWRYNGAKLSFYWPYMLVLMILNTSKLSASHLSCAAAIFFVDCCQFVPNRFFGLKIELMAYAGLVGGTTEKSCIFLTLYVSINDMDYFWTV